MVNKKYQVTGCWVGPFTIHHNYPPAPFNPDYDPRAVDWLTLACADAQKAGVYKLPLNERPEKIRAFYDSRKAKGTPNKYDVLAAKELLSDC